MVTFVIIAAVSGSFILFLAKLGKGPSTGYYNYNGNMYYWQNTTDSWYSYDYDTGTWNFCFDDLDYLYDHYNDYSVYFYKYYDVSDFTESDRYVAPESSTYSWDNDSNWYNDNSWDNDWDDDYSWDNGSDWDSGLDDWDSDW